MTELLARLGNVFYWLCTGVAGLLGLVCIYVLVWAPRPVNLAESIPGFTDEEMSIPGFTAEESAVLREAQRRGILSDKRKRELIRRSEEAEGKDAQFVQPFISPQMAVRAGGFAVLAIVVWLIGRATRYIMAGK